MIVKPLFSFTLPLHLTWINLNQVLKDHEILVNNKFKKVKKKKTEVSDKKETDKSFDDLLEEMVEENKSVTSGIKKILKDIEKRETKDN